MEYGNETHDFLCEKCGEPARLDYEVDFSSGQKIYFYQCSDDWDLDGSRGNERMVFGCNYKSHSCIKKEKHD